LLLVALIQVQGGAQTVNQESSAAIAPALPGEIRILVGFRDGKGRPVPAPSKDALLAHLGGTPIEIDDLRSLKNEPLIFSLIVDKSRSTLPSAGKQTAAAVSLFRALSTGDNHGYLTMFNAGVSGSKQFVDASVVEQTLKETPPRGSTALYDAIVFACKQQLNSTLVPSNSRRAIFVFSDGGDNTSRISLTKTVEVAQKAGIPIISIKIRVDTESQRQSKSELAALKSLSEGTGGVVVLPDEDRDAMGLLPSLLEGQSLLTLKTPALKPQKSYALKIETPSKNVKILSQTEFIAP
jgi:VWFA-related protein